MADELGERTEDPTSKRKSQARNQGQVAKSQDLSSSITLLGAIVVMLMFGADWITRFALHMKHWLSSEALLSGFDPTTIKPDVVAWSFSAARILMPAFLLMSFFAILAQVGQVGWLFTTYPLKPKLSKLNPISGAKRLVNKKNLVKTVVNTGKLVLVGGVAIVVMRRNLGRIVGLPQYEIPDIVQIIARMALELAIWLVVILLLLGIIDWVYQRWQHKEDLKMTKQQVKDERRSMEGDPQVKSRRFRMMQDIILNQIQTAVPQADVVVTNPTHFSVAIRYDPEKMSAPKVTAKGADFLAFRIRHLAIASGVPIVERAPLARAIYSGIEVGQEISPEHYEAVAEVLAYVYRMESSAA